MRFLRMVLVAALTCSGALIAPQPARGAADNPSGDPAIVISALHYYGYEGALDEAIQLTNAKSETMTLDANWSLADQADHRLAFPTLVLPPAGRVWIARDRPAFVRQFGFTPTLTYGDMAGAPLVFANTGGSVRLITATQTITVPGTLALVDTANSDTTHWDAGSKTPFRSSMERVDAGLPNTPGNWKSALLPAAPAVDAAGRPITGTPRSRNSAAVTPTTPTSLTVVINEVAWSGTPVSPTREWVELYNALTTSVSLADWKLAISGTTIYTVALSGAVEPGGYYLIQRYADTFGPGVLADLTSSSLQLRDNGAVLSLIESSSGSVTPGVERVVDALVYGDGAPQPGWSGAPLQPYVVTGTITPVGQVLMRTLDPAGGLPQTGAGMAQGWVNQRGDPVTSRRPVYPGWDTDRFAAPVVATGAVTLAVTPDGGFAVLSQTLSAATRSIEAEVYVFEHPALAVLLRMKSAQGVSVRLLLEGSPAGGLSNQEKWACQQISASGNPNSGCWFMHSDPPSNVYARYPHLHAKFAVVDGRLLVVSSENFGANGFPDDDKADGTVGQRGVIAVVDSPTLVRRAREIFDADLDTAHQDIARWCGTCSPFGPPSPGFTPVFTTGGISYTVRFPSAIRIAAPVTIEMATSPESHLREGGILAVLNSAGPGDEVLAQQLDEPTYWGPSNSNPDADPNPRLQAILGAAQRGARVRVVLDRYYDSPADARSNQSTADWLTALARANGWDLRAVTGDPTFHGIHNKLFLARVGGRGYAQIGSWNGTETSAKRNRELTLLLESDEAYQALRRVVEADFWTSQPVFVPAVMSGYAPPPAVSHPVVSEVLYNPGGADEIGREWIEIYNPSNAPVSLRGHKIGDSDAPGRSYGEGMYAFPQAATLPAFGALVVAQRADLYWQEWGRRPDYELSDYDPAVPELISYTPWSTGTLSLGNAGDQVILLGADDRAIDSAVWGSATFTGTAPYTLTLSANHSLQRWPPDGDTDNCASDFRDQPMPSPGAAP